MKLHEAIALGDEIRHESWYDGRIVNIKHAETPIIAYKFLVSDKWRVRPSGKEDFIMDKPKSRSKKKHAND